jgi:hypothetical protein
MHPPTVPYLPQAYGLHARGPEDDIALPLNGTRRAWPAPLTRDPPWFLACPPPCYLGGFTAKASNPIAVRGMLTGKC